MSTNAIPRPRVAIVTGGASGIGLATVEYLLAAGHRVAAVDRDAEGLARLATHAAGPRLMTVVADLARAEAPAQVASAVAGQLGAVSILVNNAGIAPKHNGRGWNAVEVSLEEWHTVLAINLTAVLLLSKAVIPGMQAQRYGRIVNVSSSAGRTAAFQNGAAYMASKAGLLGLTRHFASAFGRDGITANAVAPGRIVTPLSSQWSAEREALYNQTNPVGRSGTMEEAAAAIGYLASEQAGFTNGAIIDVNGGAFMA